MVLFLLVGFGLELHRPDPEPLLLVVLFGAVVGTIPWYLGVKEINAKWEPLIETFAERSLSDANTRLAMETADNYSFIEGVSGSPPLVEPKRRYNVSSVFVGDDSVAVVSDAFYNVENRAEEVDTVTSELFYERVTSVDASNDELQINHMDGEPLLYRHTFGPKEKLNRAERDLRERLRATKRESTA